MIDLYAMTAADLMTTDLIRISAVASLQEAAGLMSRNRIHSLLVANEDPRRGLGIITVKDIVQLLGDGDASVLDDLCVGDVMSCPALAVQQGLCVVDCVNLMLMAGVRLVFVLDGSDPVGLLSYTDVINAVAAASD